MAGSRTSDGRRLCPEDTDSLIVLSLAAESKSANARGGSGENAYPWIEGYRTAAVTASMLAAREGSWARGVMAMKSGDTGEGEEGETARTMEVVDSLKRDRARRGGFAAVAVVAVAPTLMPTEQRGRPALIGKGEALHDLRYVRGGFAAVAAAVAADIDADEAFATRSPGVGKRRRQVIRPIVASFAGIGRKNEVLVEAPSSLRACPRVRETADGRSWGQPRRLVVGYTGITISGGQEGAARHTRQLERDSCSRRRQVIRPIVASFAGIGRKNKGIEAEVVHTDMQYSSMPRRPCGHVLVCGRQRTAVAGGSRVVLSLATLGSQSAAARRKRRDIPDSLKETAALIRNAVARRGRRPHCGATLSVEPNDLQKEGNRRAETSVSTISRCSSIFASVFLRDLDGVFYRVACDARVPMCKTRCDAGVSGRKRVPESESGSSTKTRLIFRIPESFTRRGLEGRYHRESCPRAREQGSGEYIDEILTEVRDERVPKEAAENGDLLYTQTHPWSLPRPPAVTGSHLSLSFGVQRGFYDPSGVHLDTTLPRPNLARNQTRISMNIDESAGGRRACLGHWAQQTTWHRSVVSSPEAPQRMELDMPARTTYGPRRVLQGLVARNDWSDDLPPLLSLAAPQPYLSRRATALQVPHPRQCRAATAAATAAHPPRLAQVTEQLTCLFEAIDHSVRPTLANDKTTRLPPAMAACCHSYARWTCPQVRASFPSSSSLHHLILLSTAPSGLYESRPRTSIGFSQANAAPKVLLQCHYGMVRSPLFGLRLLLRSPPLSVLSHRSHEPRAAPRRYPRRDPSSWILPLTIFNFTYPPVVSPISTLPSSAFSSNKTTVKWIFKLEVYSALLKCR
ncbi:hypothetical protein C8R46DRAFT_1042079 [Mycena filopes]|nr:hypothetical protein C8R46DRAFT_1042079 [Mycena filopes]